MDMPDGKSSLSGSWNVELATLYNSLAAGSTDAEHSTTNPVVHPLLHGVLSRQVLDSLFNKSLSFFILGFGLGPLSITFFVMSCCSFFTGLLGLLQLYISRVHKQERESD